MNAPAVLRALAGEMRAELVERILPYWSEHAVDEERGGFFGSIGPDGEPDAEAPWGAVLNARVLWTFSAARRVLGSSRVLDLADRAADVITRLFLDPEHGGAFWTIRPGGEPVDERKYTYAQAFAVYALSEHHRATGRESSLREARTLFGHIEMHAFDARYGGYWEVFDRDWTLVEDGRLSERDLVAPKSQNTQLHLLEAYSALYRVWPDRLLEARLLALVELFADRIVDGSAGHGRPFFERDWTALSEEASFGHDIETAWLLWDAAEILGAPEISARAGEVATCLATRVLESGVDPRGGVFLKAHPDGRVERDKVWWPQAEAVVGFLAAYGKTAHEAFLAAAWNTWAFIKTHLLDHRLGEWHQQAAPDGTPRLDKEKVGLWKGPYHSARACIEVMERSRRLLEVGGP